MSDKVDIDMIGLGKGYRKVIVVDMESTPLEMTSLTEICSQLEGTKGSKPICWESLSKNPRLSFVFVHMSSPFVNTKTGEGGGADTNTQLEHGRVLRKL